LPAISVTRCGLLIRVVDQHRSTDMETRHVLARIAAVVTAAAAIGMFLGPAPADAAEHAPDSSANRDSTSSMAQQPGSRVDGWANVDVDIGAFDWSVAEELGSRLDGWDTPEMDLNPSELWEAMAFGIGSILDGWANRYMDIGAFSSATTAAGQPSWPVRFLPYVEQLD
jgi:hypothetical protein